MWGSSALCISKRSFSFLVCPQSSNSSEAPNGTDLLPRAPVKLVNAVAHSSGVVWSWIQRPRKSITEVVASNYHLECLHMVL